LTLLEVVELAAEQARLGSSTPLGDVLRQHPDAPVLEASRALDARPALYAKVRSGAYYEALEILAAELRSFAIATLDR